MARAESVSAKDFFESGAWRDAPDSEIAEQFSKEPSVAVLHASQRLTLEQLASVASVAPLFVLKHAFNRFSREQVKVLVQLMDDNALRDCYELYFTTEESAWVREMAFEYAGSWLKRDNWMWSTDERDRRKLISFPPVMPDFAADQEEVRAYNEMWRRGRERPALPPEVIRVKLRTSGTPADGIGADI